MYFDEEYFKGEERQGFYIRPMMKRVWAVQQEILREIDIVCQRHGIVWYAEWGTLLGAVRERGYIPWDDDLDISMRRVDFERFKRCISELPEGYVCRIERDGDISDLIYRVMNTGQIDTSPEFMERNHGCPYIAGVDIFVYDNIPEDPVEREQFSALFTYAYAAAAESAPGKNYEECSAEARALIDETERMSGVHLDRSLPMRGQLLTLADQIAAMYYDADTEEMAVMCYFPHDRKRYAFSKQWFSSVEQMPFESIKVNVPGGYREILTRWYGSDYMIPKRIDEHEYPYFKRQEQDLLRGYRERGEVIPDGLRE